MDNKRKKFRIESDEEDDIPVNNDNNTEEQQQHEDEQPQSKPEDSAPSPQPGNTNDEEEEEGDMDNLFGDDDDEEEDKAIDSRPADENGIVEDEEDEDDFRRNDGMEFAVDETKPQRELRRKAYLEQLVEDSKTLTKDEIELNRLKAENTLRWRYAKDSNGELINESNAQVVEWSDGSLSLKLGDEYFDVIQSQLTDTFLATYSEESGLLTTDGIFTNSMKIVPTSTNSKIHKKLTTAIQARQQTKPGAQSVYVDKDPEEEARALERQQEQLIRERRRKELKERKENEKYDSDSTPRPGQRATRESYYAQPRIRDEYEEDAFMVDDDEDVEEDDEEDDLEAAERLRRVKNEGAAKYNNEDEDDDEEDGDEGEDEDDEDGTAKARKKRRVIESDEDDE
ncbi:unnamed protein product [Wickerhamomyces anomalus]